MRAIVVAATALILFGVAFESHWFPLGLPSEWAWEPLSPESNFQPSSWFAFALSFLLALGMAAGIFKALRVLGQSSRGWFLAAIGLACLLGSVFQLSVEIASPTGLAKWCMFAGEGADGYYRHVRRNVPSVGHALREHAQFCATHCYPHLTTNPVGWVVVHRALLSFYEAWPAMARAAFGYELAEMTQGYEDLVGVRLPYADRASLMTIAYGSRLVGWMVGLPVAWLVWMRAGRNAALAAAAASYLIPASIMFAPRSDTAYPTVAALILALSYYAVRRASWPAAAAAGALVAGGTMFSLCFSVVGVMAAVMVSLEFFERRHVDIKAVVAASAGLALVLLIPLAFGYEPFRTWWMNLESNEKIIGDRSRWWAIANPIEMAVAMGLPVAIFLAFRVAADIRERRLDSLLIGWLAALSLLDLSGASLGEVARLWIFAMPIGVALGVERLDLSSRSGRLAIAGLVLLQAVSCILLSRQLVVMALA
ncbi:MAG TPA: hypothetical protein VG826_15425 [Pirellulales bacterium]|nr:hypothetical protein [Pirellulales bacterium]